MLKIFQYQAFDAGPTLVVLGCVHGNEPCGQFAIEAISRQLDAGDLVLSRGRLLMVPVCNPRALAQKVRFVDRNLNRYLYVKQHPTAYEDFIDPILCSVLDQADVLLDLHSYASPGGPFIFLGGADAAETSFAYSLGVNDFVSGWSEAFANQEDSEKGRLESIGTTEYVRDKGGISVTLECGQHNNDNNADIGAQAIVMALQHLQLVDGQPVKQTGTQTDFAEGKERRTVVMKTVHYKRRAGQFAKDWRHFDAVEAGELLAVYEDGEEIRAAESGYVVLPKAFSDVGGEWFYFGVPG